MGLRYDSTILVDGSEPTNRAILDLLKKINEVSSIADLAKATADSAIMPPVGYVYTQGPDDMAPSDLWPTATWGNVSSEEAGAFRRYEGGDASGFSSGQQGHAFQGHYHAQYYIAADLQTGGASMRVSTTLANTLGPIASTGVKEAVSDGVHGTPQVSSETRPVNYTVRKWRRTA